MSVLKLISVFSIPFNSLSSVLVDLKLKDSSSRFSLFSHLQVSVMIYYHPDDDVCCLWWGMITLPQIHMWWQFKHRGHLMDQTIHNALGRQYPQPFHRGFFMAPTPIPVPSGNSSLFLTFLYLTTLHLQMILSKLQCSGTLSNKSCNLQENWCVVARVIPLTSPLNNVVVTGGVAGQGVMINIEIYHFPFLSLFFSSADYWCQMCYRECIIYNKRVLLILFILF